MEEKMRREGVRRRCRRRPREDRHLDAIRAVRRRLSVVDHLLPTRVDVDLRLLWMINGIVRPRRLRDVGCPSRRHHRKKLRLAPLQGAPCRRHLGKE